MFLAIYKNAHSHMTHHQRKLYLEPRYTRYTKTQFLIYRDTHTHAVREYTHTHTPTHNHVLTHSFDLNLANEINHVSFSKRHYHHKLIQHYEKMSLIIMKFSSIVNVQWKSYYVSKL